MRGVQPVEEILISWKRCMSKALSNTASSPAFCLKEEELRMKIDKYQGLLSIVNDCIGNLDELLGDEHLFLLTDAEGTLLFKKNKRKFTQEHSGVREGMSFSEESSGTNAIALALKIKKPAYTLPQYHYCDFLKNVYCYAYPLCADEHIVGCLAAAVFEQPLKKELIAVVELLGYQITNEFKHHVRSDEKHANHKIKLNNKQIHILKLLARGLTDRAAAMDIGVSIDTVRYHKRIIFKKLQAASIVEAIIKAIKLNIMSIDQIEL